MISRRALVAGAVTAVAAPRSAAAQQTGKVYRIGFLWDTPTVWPHALEAFRQGLRDLGWVDGQNIAVEYRWTEGRFDRLPTLVEELVRLKVDLIVAPTSIYTGAAKRATSTIPDRLRKPRRSDWQRPRGQPRASRHQCHGTHDRHE
jgi:putative ABC transport system substrate-binding protein